MLFGVLVFFIVLLVAEFLFGLLFLVVILLPVVVGSMGWWKDSGTGVSLLLKLGLGGEAGVGQGGLFCVLELLFMTMSFNVGCFSLIVIFGLVNFSKFLVISG